MKTEAEQDLAIAHCATAVLLIPGLLWEAFVICRLWAWFVVPLGVTPLRLFQAAGISLLVGAVTFRTLPKPETPELQAKWTWQLCGNQFWVPAIALLFGWLAHLWM